MTECEKCEDLGWPFGCPVRAIRKKKEVFFLFENTKRGSQLYKFCKNLASKGHGVLFLKTDERGKPLSNNQVSVWLTFKTLSFLNNL
ncbi:MAG: hypothetical protein Q8O39_02160 [bacterium]|nr:hypothetical protein [bacterium]